MGEERHGVGFQSKGYWLSVMLLHHIYYYIVTGRVIYGYFLPVGERRNWRGSSKASVWAL